jgi:putative tryptophan/tyrosine transport system substrate-binding protein
MPKIFFFFLLTTLLITAVFQPAQAQQPAKIPRIAWLSNLRFSEIPNRVEAFRQGLRELGYVEGKNIVIEWREGNNDQVPALAAELVRLKVDVIVSGALSLTRAAKAATSTIPIVMAQDPDPVGNGFVASLAHPGGNITGLSTLAPELNGKKLEILKEVIPRISRVAVFVTSTVRDPAQVSKEVEIAAQALKVKLQYLDVLTPADFEKAFREAIKGRAEGILMEVAGPVYIPHRKKTPELAAKSRLPVMYRRPQDVEAGGLMSYGVNVNDLDRRAATYVDKILKGAKPADLPVEQPIKFEFIINLKAAKQIGLTIPPNVLARADKVIR